MFEKIHKKEKRSANAQQLEWFSPESWNERNHSQTVDSLYDPGKCFWNDKSSQMKRVAIPMVQREQN